MVILFFCSRSVGCYDDIERGPNFGAVKMRNAHEINILFLVYMGRQSSGQIAKSWRICPIPYQMIEVYANIRSVELNVAH